MPPPNKRPRPSGAAAGGGAGGGGGGGGPRTKRAKKVEEPLNSDDDMGDSQKKGKEGEDGELHTKVRFFCAVHAVTEVGENGRGLIHQD